jgi:hypothetical protein
MKLVRRVEKHIRQKGFGLFRPSNELMKELSCLKTADRRGIYIHVMPGFDKFYFGKSIDILGGEQGGEQGGQAVARVECD